MVTVWHIRCRGHGVQKHLNNSIHFISSIGLKDKQVWMINGFILLLFLYSLTSTFYPQCDCQAVLPKPCKPNTVVARRMGPPVTMITALMVTESEAPVLPNRAFN